MKKFSILSSGLTLLFVLGVASSLCADTIFINFTNAASSTGALNTLNHTDTSVRALNDITDAASGVSIQMTSLPSGGNSTGAPGPITGDAATAGITAGAGLTYHFTTNDVVATYSFTGLTPVTTNYTFTVFGSRDAGDTRTTEYTLSNGGAPESQSLVVAGPVNNSNVVVFNPIVASGSGTLTFSFVDDMTSGNQFGYLNEIRIDTSPVPEASSILLLGLAVGGFLVFRRR